MILWDFDVGGLTELSLEQRIRGMELIDEASALQSSLLPLLLDKSNAGSFDHRSPLYCWPLVSISQMLKRDSWQLLGCDLPALSSEKLREQANALISMVFDLMGWRMCVPFFLPMVYWSGFEMKSKEERERVLRCIDESQIKHYNLVMMFRKDLITTWQGTDTGGEGVCDRRLPMHERAQAMLLMRAEAEEGS
jgi:hypothetical protein